MHLTFPGGETRPALGLGTYGFGEQRAQRARDVAAVRMALELGYRVIDTAEMYGAGAAEEIVGEAIAAAGVPRDELFVVSKVLPHNASRRGTVEACERSLERLGLDRIDLYLLHWRGGEALGDTLAAFQLLQQRGLVRHWGVSNFDVADMEELFALDGGSACAANQVYYSLSRRGIEFDLLPWLRERGVPLMAYSPIDQGALGRQGLPPALAAVAARHGATPAQGALAFVLAQPGVMAIPKAGQAQHLRDNLAAAALRLSPADLAQLAQAFPPPRRKQPLATS
jgi:diketogulonate reductase-like aldo/keto reductase